MYSFRKVFFLILYVLGFSSVVGQKKPNSILPEFLGLEKNGLRISSSANLTSDDTLKILPLGNSITFDKRTNDPRIDGDKYGYRLDLHESLSNDRFIFDFIGSEKSGWNFLPNGYEDNAGFPGMKDNELLNLLETGWRVQVPSISEQITIGPYLETYLPDVILLHTGTNGNDAVGGTSAEDIESILDEIDRVEILTNKEIKVILAKIINRVPFQNYVSELNYNIDSMATDRNSNPLNSAYPDNITLVDMENSASIIYAIDSLGTVGNGIIGDMNDSKHPNDKGYAKMANVWYNAIKNLYSNPILIVKQPEEVLSPVGVSAEFSISITSSKPIHYQWKKDGNDILGANDSILITEPLTIDDNFSKYVCEITSGYFQEISDTAVIIIADSTMRISTGLIAEYNFEEGSGNIIQNQVAEFEGLDLQINDISDINWIPFGLHILSPADIETVLPAVSIYNNITSTNEMTLEAWIEPSNITQIGPARIFTFSENSNSRNFTFSQDADSFEVRFRTSLTTANGKPSTFSHEGTGSTSLTHIAFVRDWDGNSSMYVNGELNNNINISGDLSVWDSTNTLALANEVGGGRPWLGKIYLVSLFNRALSGQEIEHNFNAKFNGFDYLLKKPTNLAGSTVNIIDVELNWNDNSDNELGFVIERKANKLDSVYVVVDSVGADIMTFVDSTAKFDSSYIYRIKAYNEAAHSEYSNETIINDIPVGIDENILTQKSFELFQNYPNPFNPTTKIQFTLQKESKINLIIYNPLGEIVEKLVDSEIRVSGNYSEIFNAENLATGIYIYRLVAEPTDGSQAFTQIRKSILLK